MALVQMSVSSSAGLPRSRSRPSTSSIAMDSRIHFSEVASYVGLALNKRAGRGHASKPGTAGTLRSVSTPDLVGDSSHRPLGDGTVSMLPPATSDRLAAGGGHNGFRPLPDNGGAVATPMSSVSAAPPAKENELPQLRVGRAERLTAQLDWLRMEHRVAQEHLKRKKAAMEEANKRAEVNREQFDFQLKRSSALQQQIQSLREELDTYEKPREPRRNRTPASVGAATAGFGTVAAEPASTSVGRNASASSSLGGRSQTHTLRLDTGELLGLSGGMSLEDGAADAVRTSVPSNAPGRARRSTEEQVPADAGSGDRADHGLDQGVLATRQASTPSNAPGRDPTQAIEAAASSTEPAESLAQADEALDGEGNAAGSKERRARMSTVEIPENTENLSEAELHELWKTKIREGMVEFAGTARQAFKNIDLNGSGSISLQEFVDGLDRLKVRWQEITGKHRPKEVFRMFDLDKSGSLDFRKLFPVEYRLENQPKRATTPEFWKVWCRKNRPADFEKRPASWNPGNPDEELEVLFGQARSREEANVTKKWLSASFKRLKNKGKSDARARECVALHLPRGTGPRDRDGVGTFSEYNVKACKKEYQDEVLNPVKKMQKVVYDMRDSRKILTGYKQQLYQISMEPYMRQKAEEERRQVAASLSGGGAGGFGGLSLFKKVTDMGDGQQAAPQKSGPRTMAAIAKDVRMDESTAVRINQVFGRHQDERTELISRKKFVTLLEDLCPGRTFAESDIEVWWEQVRTLEHSGDLSGAGDGARVESKHRKMQANFEQFLLWYGESECRN